MHDVHLSDSAVWSDFRRMMPVTETWAYFDHAAVAPITRVAGDELRRWADHCEQNGGVDWSEWRKGVEKARKLGAQLINSHTDEIAIVHNTTEGVNIVAEGFPWQPGDNVVMVGGEFPTNRYAWMHLATRGVEPRVVPVSDERLDLAKLESMCDHKTRIVAVSWVGYATGWRNDLNALVEIAHRKGALLFVDAIQALGVFPLDVAQTPIDFLAADGHKWMLGPEGAGLFYLRRAHLELLRPIGIGWNSAANSGEYGATELNLKLNAGRYEGGSYNMGGIAALARSLEFLLGIGVARISARLLEVTDIVSVRLASIGAEIGSCREDDHRSGIVAFNLADRSPVQTRKHCLDRKVALNCRAGRLRVSPHAYTSNDDIERLIEVLTDER